MIQSGIRKRFVLCANQYIINKVLLKMKKKDRNVGIGS